MSTEIIFKLLRDKKCKLFSVDNIDYSKKFSSDKWKFIKTRDDNFEIISSRKFQKKIDLILLDTIHESRHVEKINIIIIMIFLKKDCCFFIDDISWLPYLKNSEKKSFLCREINNYETFVKLLEIYNNNQTNFNIEVTFEKVPAIL